MIRAMLEDLFNWKPQPKDRAANKLYAERHGLFRLPCPRCGKLFGGHKYKGAVMTSNGRGKVTCCPPTVRFFMGEISREWESK